jgi:hypothetical protein
MTYYAAAVEYVSHHDDGRGERVEVRLEEYRIPHPRSLECEMSKKIGHS